MFSTRPTLSVLTQVMALALLPAMSWAAGDHGAPGAKTEAAQPGHGMAGMAGMHKDAHASMAGQGGDAAKVTRTIAVEMDDNMRFTPGKIEVKAGETVRFFVVNKGKIKHEMVLGTAAEIDEHAQMMRKMPGMAHQDANQITLEPGKRGGIVWQFAKAGVVSYACLVPGHREAGMAGSIQVQ